MLATLCSGSSGRLGRSSRRQLISVPQSVGTLGVAGNRARPQRGAAPVLRVEEMKRCEPPWASLGIMCHRPRLEHLEWPEYHLTVEVPMRRRIEEHNRARVGRLPGFPSGPSLSGRLPLVVVYSENVYVRWCHIDVGEVGREACPVAQGNVLRMPRSVVFPVQAVCSQLNHGSWLIHRLQVVCSAIWSGYLSRHQDGPEQPAESSHHEPGTQHHRGESADRRPW